MDQGLRNGTVLYFRGSQTHTLTHAHTPRTGFTMSVAWRELVRESTKAGMTPTDYILNGPDPISVGVFLEDTIAVGGVGVAATCITLSYLTGERESARVRMCVW